MSESDGEPGAAATILAHEEKQDGARHERCPS